MAALIFFGLFVYAIMAYNLRSAVDETLYAVTIQLIGEVNRDGRLPIEDIIEEPQYARLRAQGFSVQVEDMDGAILQSHGPYQTLFQPTVSFTDIIHPGRFMTMIDPNTKDEVRIYAAQIIDRGEIQGFVQIARNLNDINRTSRLLFITLLISGPLLIVVAGISGYFLAASALRPIAEITSTARAISTQDLSARLHLPATDDEVGRLATTFNSMLTRLDDGFQRERQFTADAAHELRTPLAAMQTIISSTLTRQRTSADYTQALTDLRQETERLRTLTEGLLQLARNDVTHQADRTDTVDLTLLLKDVIDSLQPLAADKDLVIVDKVPAAQMTLPGDSDALIRLFVNLVNNAIKYTEQGAITISAAQPSENRLIVTISDTGIGIEPMHLPHLFDRFYRVDKSRSTEGAGLGLSIALEIARAHGGNITVESEVGKGSRFTVYLSTDINSTLSS